MKKQNRKAFTIVELVIVIAVIGILAAVLIPTFSGIIESANRAVDTQLVAQINTTLAIEDVLGGGVNDAVEIQKVIKENGLKLQTKSKGQYIWYDIEKKQAVLGGLDENGIVIEGNNARAVSNKGKFMATASSPEKFLNGYLFISQESTDGFAEEICSLRNAESANEINESLTAISEINSKAGQRLSSFMDIAAVITSTGTVISRHEDLSKARVAIASSNLTTVTDATVNALTGTKIYVVDLHSGVTKMEFTGGTTAKAKLEAATGVYFYYNNAELEKIDRSAEDGNISNLLKEGEIVVGNYTIENMAYVNKDDGKPLKDGDAQIVDEIPDGYTIIVDGVLKGLDPYYAYGGDGKGTADTVYEFVGYSLHSDGSILLPIGTTDYELNDHDKLLFQGADTDTDTIYAVYKERSPDFRVTVSNERTDAGCGGYNYTEEHSYYPAGVLTLMLADDRIIPDAEYYTHIVIMSTDVVLNAAFLGQETAELTIPEHVDELLLPYKSDKTKNSAFNSDLGTASGDLTSESNPINYDTIDGQTKLTIASGVTLNVASGATVYIDAQCNTKGTPVQGYISNNCGVLAVDGTIVSNGNITALGIIRGAGSITAESGTVTEVMTLYDWHGGSNANGVIRSNIIPFHNWRADNIRVPLTLKHQTTYKMTTALDVTGGAQLVNVEMAGPSNALFKMTEGDEVERSMSKNGNAKLTIVSGTVEDAAKSAEIYGQPVDFTKVSMPLSHFDVEIKNGAALTLSYNIYMLMPGSKVTVDEGATMNINTNVLICNTYTPRVNVTNSSVAVPLPQYPDLAPAQLINNGALVFNSDGNTKAAFAGEILSEKSGATIEVKTGTVGELKIDDGFYYGGTLGYGGELHYVEVAKLYTKAFINEEQQELSGSYTSTVTVVGDEPYVTWN